jgi:hypothetical protein
MNKLFRSVLAIGAVLAVAGPGIVLAGDPGTGYVPKVIQVIGPSSVAVNGTEDYDARVIFDNNSVVEFEGDPVVFTAARGTITADGEYTAPATAGRDRITATYSDDASGVTVTGSRIIQNTQE